MTLGPSLANRHVFADVEVGVTFEFMDALEKRGPDPLLVLASQMSSSAAVEKHFFLGDVPGFTEWTDDRRMSGLMAHSFEIANKEWSSGISIHRNEIRDLRFIDVMSRINALADRAARHKGEFMVQALINGFSGTAFPNTGNGLAFDGQLFFSASHALEGGSTMSNTLSGAALSEANLEAAEIRLAGFTTWDGRDPLDLQGTHLIVGPKLEKTALTLVGGATLLNNATASSATASAANAYFLGKYTVVVSRRLVGTYDDYWFLADLSKPTKPFIVQDREPITTAAQMDWSSPDMFRRGQMNFGAQASYGIGMYDWRTIVGSAVA